MLPEQEGMNTKGHEGQGSDPELTAGLEEVVMRVIIDHPILPKSCCSMPVPY